jgi:hypothetical protein
LLALAATSIAAPAPAWAQAQQPSAGVYRIPYTNGTDVRVSNDHLTHSPIGRIDMSGRNGDEPYRIVAAADGTIRFIVDNFSAQIASGSGQPCTNNYVWIEHANGEWTKYSHMRQNSTSSKANLKVGQFVKAGTYLGDEGQVGCASGPHLHFEVGVPRATNPIATVGGFLNDNAGSARNRIPRICGIANRTFVDGETYEARAVPGNLTPGGKEVARHGLPIRDYQCLFDQASNAGYQPVWLDFFDVDGNTYVNAIFRPASGGAMRAYHGLTGDEYQARFDQAKKDGFRPVIVESYLDDGVRYAAVFRKTSGPAYRAYHGRDAEFHQARIDEWSKEGYVPRSISVVSSGGRKYTALYEKTNVGGWQAKSQLAPAEYQAFYDANAKLGRRIAYLNGYRHGGDSFIVAIATSVTPAGGKQRHGMTGAAYQTEWESARQANMLTRAVTAYEADAGARYAASWRP